MCRALNTTSQKGWIPDRQDSYHIGWQGRCEIYSRDWPRPDSGSVWLIRFKLFNMQSFTRAFWVFSVQAEISPIVPWYHCLLNFAEALSYLKASLKYWCQIHLCCDQAGTEGTRCADKHTQIKIEIYKPVIYDHLLRMTRGVYTYSQCLESLLSFHPFLCHYNNDTQMTKFKGFLKSWTGISIYE